MGEGRDAHRNLGPSALLPFLANAFRHGCRGDSSKHVQCSVSCEDSGEVVMVVRDPGPGFDPSAIADPLDAANLLKPSGRGVFLINELMDEVQFADGGREVQMRKKKARYLPANFLRLSSLSHDALDVFQ